ncbi:MAG: hypothetical protein A2W76_06945 [Gammaproteobacteria bacterium RIFCSPLOWO2_12_47_11]|nr:MAG: hypothetical protein A2W76_06945 [Gammaproteobacteria bacterium RIFCSPLOWO2_12_47_11]
MAKFIIWSEESLQDIECIAEYISRDSIHHAQLKDTIIKRLQSNARFHRALLAEAVETLTISLIMCVFDGIGKYDWKL